MLKALNVFTLIALALVAPSPGWAQGFVSFNNTPAFTGGTDARVRELSLPGCPYIGATGYPSGSNYLAQLYSGPFADDETFTGIGYITGFQSGANAGYVQTSGTTPLGYVIPPGGGNSVVLQNAHGQAFGYVQLRMWGRPFATFESAVSGGGVFGRSNIIQATGNFPPSAPARLVGLLFPTLCPEPSVFGLAMAGVAALLFVHRRRNPPTVV